MLQSGKKWSLLLGSFCAVSAAFADAGAEEENGVLYEAEKPAVRPYIMVKGGLPKSGAHRVSGHLHLGTVRGTGVVGLDGMELNIPVSAKDQTSKCGFMGSFELGAKYKWVCLGLELGYIQADTKTSKLAELLELDTGAKIKNAIGAPVAAFTNDQCMAGVNAVSQNKFGVDWNDVTTKIRFHQPFGAVNLTLDVPLNKYFTAYIGSGVGACYEVARLHLNGEDKIPFRKMRKLFQGFAGIGVNISEGWSLRGGYRPMRIDNKRYSMKKDNQEIGIEGGGTAKGFEVALMYHF